MIEPTTLLFSGIDQPILSVLYRTQRAITVWALFACEGDGTSIAVTQEQVTQAMNTHATPLIITDDANGLLGKIIPGEFIAPRLAGKYFMAKQRVCLDQDVGLSPTEWADCSHFAFPMRSTRVGSPENRYIATKELKNTLTRLLQLNWESSMVNLYIPFAAYNLDQGSVHVACHPEYGVVANFPLPDQMLPLSAMQGAAALVRPKLVFNGPASIAPDSYADVQLSVTSATGVVQDDVPARVYFDVVSGYVPKPRLDLVGQTTIRVGALGLVPGDSVHIKAGFKNFSGVAEIQIPVV